MNSWNQINTQSIGKVGKKLKEVKVEQNIVSKVHINIGLMEHRY